VAAGPKSHAGSPAMSASAAARLEENYSNPCAGTMTQSDRKRALARTRASRQGKSGKHAYNVVNPRFDMAKSAQPKVKEG
jgi:hypothetical protein